MTTYVDWPCNQKAVYWPPGSESTSVARDFDDYGKPLYADAVEIDCRWDDCDEEITLPDGKREFSTSKVIVDRDVSLRGVLWLGELADVTYLDAPKDNEGAFEIKKITRTPMVDEGDEFLVRAFL